MKKNHTFYQSCLKINQFNLEINNWISRDKIESVGFGKLNIKQDDAVIFS